MVNGHIEYSPKAFDFPRFKNPNTSGVFQVATCTLKSKSDNSSNLFKIEKICIADQNSFLGIIKYLSTDYSDESNFIVAFDSNYFVWLRRAKSCVSRDDKLCYRPHSL